MCLPIEVLTQKFGFQRAAYYTGVTNEQKALNGFEPTIYIPTNWRNNGYTPLESKAPEFVRYGAFQPITPEWFQKNYYGTFSLKNQPTVEQPEAFTVARYS